VLMGVETRRKHRRYSGCRFPEADGGSFIFQSVKIKTDPEVRPPSYAIGAWDPLIDDKEAGA
jgi:hypothetical protein